MAPGGTIDFFLRDPQAVGIATTGYPLAITRVAAPDAFMGGVSSLQVGAQAVPVDASTNGCQWTSTYQLTIPLTWPSGLYYAFLGNGANACTIPFVVRAAANSAGVKTLVMIPVTTAHAYNPYGGKSIYDYNSTGGQRAAKVSLDRPFADAFNSFFDVWSQSLVRWMAKNAMAADFCTDIDIESNPSILSPYQLVIIGGHDEYWSSGRRTTMDGYVSAGGNVAYLGGNTAWFQARLEAGNGVANRTLVCYKDAAADPVTDPALKTVNYIALQTPRPENTTCGLGYVTGCSWTSTLPRPDTPSVVMRPEHWAFAGTGLAQGAGFGGAYVGYESNSASFSLGTDQRAYPTGSDGTPATLRILASADGSNWNALSLAAGGPGEQSGYAQIAVFSRGGSAGTVFNAGSNDWCYGLIPEINGQTPTPISRITLNVINQLSKRWSESADVRQFHGTAGGLSNNNYYGTGTTAPTGSGMALDGWVFRAFAAPLTTSVPVYRYRSTVADPTRTSYRLRTNAVAPAGWTLDAVAFHAYATSRSDATPVYEHFAPNSTLGTSVYLYSTNATPPAGWSAGPIAFYAPTDSGTATPLPPAPTPSFTLAATSTTLSVVQGKAVSGAITVSPANGFTGTVSFNASGLPSGVAASFTATTGGTTISLSAGAAAVPGSYPITVTGSSPGTTGPASIGLTLTVVAAPVQSFTLTASPASLNLPFFGLLGGSASISVAGVNGFASAVSFSVSGVPAGFQASFSPASSASGTRLNIAKNLFAFVPAGSYPVTVTGTSGALSASTRVTLVVRVAL